MLSNESFMRLLYRQEESESIVTGIRTMINGIIRTCFGLYFPQTNGLTQPAFTCSKVTESLEQGVKYVQSQQ